MVDRIMDGIGNFTYDVDQALKGEDPYGYEDQYRRAREGQLGRASRRGAVAAPTSRPEPLQGYLHKKSRGGFGSVSWKRRYFFQSGVFVYISKTAAERPQARFSLRDVHEVSKRYENSIGPCIGVTVSERLYVLSPGKNCTGVELRVWYDGFCKWQQWLDANPDDQPPERSGGAAFKPKRSNFIDGIDGKINRTMRVDKGRDEYDDAGDADEDAHGGSESLLIVDDEAVAVPARSAVVEPWADGRVSAQLWRCIRCRHSPTAVLHSSRGSTKWSAPKHAMEELLRPWKRRRCQ